MTELAGIPQGALAIADVGLAGTEVTDAGLEQLKGLSQLRELNLDRTSGD